MRTIMQPGPPPRGIALVTALIFLIVITLLGLSSMRLSSTELKMAQNDQARVSALETAQAAVDAVSNDPTATPVSDFGSTMRCYGTGCADPTITLSGALFSQGVYASATRAVPFESPVVDSLMTSSDKFSMAAFTLQGSFDRSAEGMGAARIEQGHLELIPKETRIRQ